MGLEVQGDKTEKWLNMTCPICGKKYHLKPYAVKRNKMHFCSKECHNKAKQSYFSGSGNHQYGLKGDKNPTWNGGHKVHLGYIWTYSPEHPFSVGRPGYVLEHRLVAEKYLLTEDNSVDIGGKKYLSREFVVHHKNGIRTDNRPDNLEVIRKGEHTRLHNEVYDRFRNRTLEGRYAKGSVPVRYEDIYAVEELNQGERGDAGFGSTGK